MLHVPLQIVFNKLLQQGYSASLSTRVIHALHKGGDALQFENYRGITVGPVLAKVFAMILEARLSSWVEERGLHAKGQAGFRKDFHTTDNLHNWPSQMDTCQNLIHILMDGQDIINLLIMTNIEIMFECHMTPYN
jgi:hypothetical protein